MLGQSLLIGLLGMGLLLPPVVHAEAYRPTTNQEILERLPAGLPSGVAQASTTPAAAASTAQRYLSVARRDGDPRYLGYAEAILAPWQDDPQPDPQLLLLRATVHQAQHRFDAALADLSQLLETHPRHPQGWLTRATVEQVTGDLDAARRSCGRLLGLVSALVITACSTATSADQQATANAYRLLADQLRTEDADDSVRRWALTILAETAERLGDQYAAEQHYQEAVMIPGNDAYLQGAYARFLLDQGRYDVAAQLLGDISLSDELLLLRTRIEAARQGQRLVQFRQQVQQRLMAVQQRGDNLHPQFQAEAALFLEDDPTTALNHALTQWQRQREARDLRLLLQAALGAGQPEAVQPALTWLADSGFYDARLESLLRQGQQALADSSAPLPGS